MSGGSVNIDTELYGSFLKCKIYQENTFTITGRHLFAAGVEAERA